MMKNFIKITKQSFGEGSFRSFEIQFKMLEKFLERHTREFEVDDFDKAVTVFVRDESDALWLLDNARLKSAKYHKDGEVRDLALNFEKQKGSPRNIVQVEGIEKSMSINQFKMRPLRELEKTHLTRSQIVKAKVFTPQQLNKYIGAGILQVVRHGRKIFISRADIVRLIKSNLKD